MRLLPDIGTGTHGYPEKVARRLRAMNFTAWTSAVLSAGFGLSQVFDASPGVRKVAVLNISIAVVLAATPLLHRFSALAAPLVFATVTYASIFVVCSLFGTGTGMQAYFLVSAAVIVLFFGTERVVLSAVFIGLAAALIIALEFTVPRNTGMQSDAQIAMSFVATVTAACVMVGAVVFYAVREGSSRVDLQACKLEYSIVSPK